MSWFSVTSMFEVHSMPRKRADKENMLTEGQMNTSNNGQDDKLISKTAGRHSEKETDGKSEGQVASTNNDTYNSTCLLWTDSNITVVQSNHKRSKPD